MAKEVEKCGKARLSYCSLPKGHDGEHYNDFDEVYWTRTTENKHKVERKKKRLAK